MKRMIFIVVFIMPVVFAFGQGVNFQELNFQQALTKAKAENKYVFVDCYTTWCGPCKQMREHVLTRASAGEYFNPKFVCVEYDMEREGKELGKLFGVRVFPTYLIIHPDGTLYHKLVGSSLSADDFVAKVKKGMEKENSFSYLEKLHVSGRMNNKELRKYYFLLKETAEGERAAEVLRELWTRLTDGDKVQAEYWFLFENREYKDEGFEFVMANLDTLRKNVGAWKVDMFLNQCYSGVINKYMDELEKGEWSDKEAAEKEMSDSRELLATIDMKSKAMLLEQISFVEACLRDDARGELAALEEMVVSRRGNTMILPKILRIIRKQGNKVLASGVIAMKDKILDTFSMESDKKKYGEIIDGLGEGLD
ncbi:thioredoxin family protein [Butyricimonas sp. Marseille-P3923]|uniref:thioredoxin family protein n=1 Tax=Butyricimonas sp. Marseille-P3923 TaxID=1987504 RepID=UPI00159BAC99|nr:thioredoxin family protein [Butyricimonas sp. Marseille-P3923]